MLLLCAIWGSQQVAIKLAADDIAPMLQVALRSGVAAVLVGLLLLWQRGWREWLSTTWLAGILAGVLFALEFFFIALGLRYTTASHMAVFLYGADLLGAGSAPAAAQRASASPAVAGHRAVFRRRGDGFRCGR